MGEHCFAGCKNMESITFNCSVSKINNMMFDGNNKLTTINLRNNDSIESLSIGLHAFSDCTSLKNLNGLDWSKVTQIADGAFNNCSLLSGTVKVNPQCYIHENALTGCPLIITK